MNPGHASFALWLSSPTVQTSEPWLNKRRPLAKVLAPYSRRNALNARLHASGDALMQAFGIVAGDHGERKQGSCYAPSGGTAARLEGETSDGWRVGRQGTVEGERGCADKGVCGVARNFSSAHVSSTGSSSSPCSLPNGCYPPTPGH